MKDKNRSCSRAELSPELLERARGGDQTAFAALYEQINPALYHSVRAMVQDEDLAWDVLQNSWLRAFRSLDRLEADEAFLPWLRRIAVNEAVRQVGRRQPVSFTELGDGADEAWPELPDPDPTVQPELALDRQETARLVREILAELPEQQQLIVGMRYYEDMSVREIAETLGVASGTVKAQLFQGRKKVETKVRALERQGIKLYGLGPIPFLAALVRGLEPARAAEQRTLAAVLAQAPAAGGGALAGSAAAAGTVLETATAPAAVTAMTAGQTFLHGLGAKLLAGALALALVGGGIWAGSRLLKDRRPVPEDPTAISTEAAPVPTQRTGPEDETRRPRRELVGNECGAEGDNLTWRFDEKTGTLYIEGSGAMADFIDGFEQLFVDEEEYDTPWSSFSQRITRVSLPEGLRSIGSGAFLRCENLRSIEIPENVSSLGDAVFCGCAKLGRIAIPAKVRSIGRYCFAGVPIREGFSVSPDNPAYSSDENGILFTKDGTDLICCPSSLAGSYSIPDTVHTIGEYAFSYCFDLSGIIIPDSVSSIGEYAFVACSLQSVTIPKGVTSIGRGAFNGCESLTAVTIPDSVTAIEDRAFCYCRALTSITIPGSVRTIGDSAFENCTGLSAVTISEGVSSIGSRAFANCSFAEISLPASLSFLDNNAFVSWWNAGDKAPAILVAEGNSAYASDSKGVLFNADRTELLSVPGSYEGAYEIPETVTVIGESAFSGCSALSAVTLPDGLRAIGDSAFSGCSVLKEVTIPGSVSTVGDGAFNGCFLRELTIQDGVSSIGSSAFAECCLDTVKLPGSVRSIGICAFAGAVENGFSVDPDNPDYSSDSYGALLNKDQTALLCVPSSLEAYSVPATVSEIEVAAFSGCSELAELTLSDSLCSIGAETFSGCDNLCQLTIPRNVTDISWDAFVNCSNLRGLLVSPENPVYSSDESGVLFNQDKTVLIQMFRGYEGAYSVPESVVTIGEGAFRCCDRLQAITIPEGVCAIADWAFDNCSALSAVTLPDSLRSIGCGVFESCSSLTSIEIPEGVESIGKNAFIWCSALRELKLPDGISTLAEGLCLYCGSLGSVTIPDTVSSIGEFAFENCTGLESITIPAGVSFIGNSAFSGCVALRSATVLADEISFGMFVFDGCPELTIRGNAGGAAEAYAAENGISFTAIAP